MNVAYWSMLHTEKCNGIVALRVVVIWHCGPRAEEYWDFFFVNSKFMLFDRCIMLFCACVVTCIHF